MNKEKLLKQKELIKTKPSNSAIEITTNIFLEFDVSNLKHKHLDLADKTKEKWIDHIQKTIDLLENKTPKSFSKIKKFLDIIVPYGYEKGIQKSLSYVNSLCIIYISYQDSEITQAEAIIHEVNHSIIFLFSKLDSGILNEYLPKYYSAVQNKPRELQNCFLALHAFVHVLEFYLELKENTHNTNLSTKIFSTYLKSLSLINIIEKYSKFTIEGKKLFQEIKKIFNDSEEKVKYLESKHKKEFESAQEEQINHFEQVTQQYDSIEF